MGPKTLLPITILSGFTGCYAAPTTASITTLTLPSQPELPFPENVPGMPPEPDHGPHGDDEPGVTLTTANSLSASGAPVTNTTAPMIVSYSQTWMLPSSPVTYDRDVEFAKLFERTGASLVVQVEDESKGKT